jgi:hypothetical protein
MSEWITQETVNRTVTRTVTEFHGPLNILNNDLVLFAVKFVIMLITTVLCALAVIIVSRNAKGGKLSRL